MQFARVRAEEQAKRVEPAVLEQAVKENVEAQTFCFWARLCVYVHGRITPLLRSYLDERCPGFIDTISSQDTADLNDVVFWQKLRDWMEMHLFARAPSEGWRDALAYYTAADSACQRANDRWSRTKRDLDHGTRLEIPLYELWRDGEAG